MIAARRTVHTHDPDDTVTLGYDDRFLRRKVLTSDRGERFLVDLAATTSLSVGDAFVLEDGRKVEALAYVINADHWQYCRGMDLEKQAQIIARAVGGRGPNTEYLWNTAAHLAELGIEDADLQWLAARVRDICR